MGADATEASAASPGREALTETEPGKLSLYSELLYLPMPLRSGSTGENDLGRSVSVDCDAGVSADGDSKRESSEA